MIVAMMRRTAKFGASIFGMKITYLLVSLLLLSGVTSLACGGGESYSLADKTRDSNYSFQVTEVSLVENIGESVPPEDYYFLILEIEVENISGQPDVLRDWSQQFTVKDSGSKECDLVYPQDAEEHMANTTLMSGEKESGSLYFTTKAKPRDFKITFKFPDSGNSVVYDVDAEDNRLGLYVDRTLDMLEQRENVRRIPVIGKTVEKINRSSLMYFGEILVPKNEVIGLIKQIKDLNDEERQEFIEDYIRELKGWS